MRIIAFTTKLNFRNAGGSVDETDLIFRSFQRSGHDLKAVTVFSSANDITHPLPYQISCEQITSGSVFGITRQFYKLLKKYESAADVFYVDGQVFLYGAGLYRRLGGTAPAAAFFNRELSVWPESYLSNLSRVREDSLFSKIKQRGRWFIEKYAGMFIANAIDVTAFTCPLLQKAYLDFGFKVADRALIIGDPLDYKKLITEQNIDENSYRRRNKQDGPFTLFYSGRMVPGKGFDFLLRAFAALSHKEQFRLILGGSGQEENRLRQMAANLAIEPYVTFTGWVTKYQIYDYLRQTDIFIHACWRAELTSVMLLEAMTFGLPSVLPGGGGIEWVAKNSAIYFDASDYRDLARKIEGLGQNRDLRNELSLRCYERLAEDELNHELNIAKLTKKMEETLPASGTNH